MVNDLTPRILHNQFVLSRELRPELLGWMNRSHAGWVLQTHPTLPVIEIRIGEGVFGGWLLGFPLNSERLMGPNSVLRCPAGPDGAMAACEQALNGLAGRWLAIVFASGQGRVYLDASGSLAAVYSVEEQVVCSTPSVIGKGREAEDWDDDLVRRGPPLWYPFGLTPHRSLRRLLLNHFLDLDLWQVVRHWPAAADVALTEDTEPVVERVAELLSGIVAAAVRSEAYMTLTAGFDTRVLLACSRDVAQKATYFTSTGSRMDVQGASELARRFGLRHLIVKDRFATKAETATRLYVTGYTTDFASISRIGNHRQLLDPRRLQVTGTGGHTGRGHATADGEVKVDPMRLARVFGMPPTARMLKGAEVWLDEVEHLGEPQILDLGFLELWVSCWAGPTLYAYDYLSLPTIHAYTHRELYRLMMTLPYSYRKSQSFFADICRLAWPETLAVPINQPWGGTKLLTYGERARKKLRRAPR